MQSAGACALVPPARCRTRRSRSWPGPSELALRVALQAIPDSILQDGFSQAAIQIEADRRRRPAGARADAAHSDRRSTASLQDFGTLSAKTVVTGDDGRARVTYTSPPRPGIRRWKPDRRDVPRSNPSEPTTAAKIERTVDLRLVSPGVIQPPLPPSRLPQPQFTVAGNAGILTNVVFDASTTVRQGTKARRSCGLRPAVHLYRGTSATATTGAGVFASHQYRRRDLTRCS